MMEHQVDEELMRKGLEEFFKFVLNKVEEEVNSKVRRVDLSTSLDGGEKAIIGGNDVDEFYESLRKFVAESLDMDQSSYDKRYEEINGPLMKRYEEFARKIAEEKRGERQREMKELYDGTKSHSSWCGLLSRLVL